MNLTNGVDMPALHAHCQEVWEGVKLLSKLPAVAFQDMTQDTKVTEKGLILWGYKNVYEFQSEYAEMYEAILEDPRAVFFNGAVMVGYEKTYTQDGATLKVDLSVSVEVPQEDKEVLEQMGILHSSTYVNRSYAAVCST